jgi:tetratricopeptide (TPR) repeat protein
MPIITIREEQPTESGFTAILSFDHRGNFPITIHDPLAAGDEQRWEWYFEEWLRFPMLDTVKAHQIADSIKNYGEALFEQVFGSNRKAYAEYEKLRGNLGTLRIEIESLNPAFQALHWEALRDPELPKPLAVEAVMIRKSSRPTAVAAEVAVSPTINLLLVTARPSRNDVAYRTISRPLLEALEQGNLRVKVDLLRPATFEALSKHLEAKGAGYYHLIHFDAHGALLSYEQFNRSESEAENRLVFKQRYGRKAISPYAGVKAFLAMEGEEEDQADLVEATELANLLTGKRIPVCILNACQSGKQLGSQADQAEDYRETSLGSRLMAAGMQMVVAMGYSVTVTAAAVLIRDLYQALFRGETIEKAIRLGRLELFNRKERQAYFNQSIELEDWLLPVVYSNQPVDFRLREFLPQEEDLYFESLAQEFRFNPPEYSFVGRDLDILRIEKGLYRHNVLLLQGMGGTGKTTLLNFLREWWQKTHFADHIFYFGYDERAWTLAQILFDIGQQVYDRFEMGRFQAMNGLAQMQKLVTWLRSANGVLILDNLESVTGEPLAIPNTLNSTEQDKLQDFLSRLVGGKSRVLLGSRSDEGWLGLVIRGNVYGLRGLDPEARTDLAKEILARHARSRAENLLKDADFGRLLKVLAGYPLAMEVVLPNLSRQSPGEVLTALQAADVDLDTGSEDRTRSILKCVEYSHSNLSEAAQNLLLCLAPFSGFILRNAIPQYAEQLRQFEPFQDYDSLLFDGAIQEAIHWGLLEPMDEEQRLLTIQPVFPYFLKTKLNELETATREALQAGFKNHYQGLAGYYNQLMASKEPQERQLGIFFCRLEYENLYQALQICLANQESIDIFFCLDKYFKLINDVQSKNASAQSVCNSLENYSQEFKQGELGYQIGFALHRLAISYQEIKQYEQAKHYFERTLESYQVLSKTEERDKKIWSAATYHQLGNVAEELREYEEAKNYYQQALAIKVEFGGLGLPSSEAFRYEQARTYHQLGSVALALREYEEARNYYQQALAIKVEFGDRYSQAMTYGQLGRVAQELREYEEARNYYQQVLAIFVEFDDRYNQAGTYHNLGAIAQDLREYEEARNNYQQALAIKVELGDRYSSAVTYHQLGRVAQELREYEEARNNYQQALALLVEFGDRYSQATTYHQLGKVAQELREYEEARNNYQQALAINVEFGDRYNQASTYQGLGVVAEDLEEFAEAKTNFLQALSIYAEFNDQYMIENFSIPALKRLYQATQDSSILETIAQLFGTTVEEVLEALGTG